ncbi:MAG: DUF4876 domain-containing protein [Tannerella sp.]|jgi:hypothetical protein|nr:DUF4876 domain-containing protein [Tannerella sp.]
MQNKQNTGGEAIELLPGTAKQFNRNNPAQAEGAAQGSKQTSTTVGGLIPLLAALALLLFSCADETSVIPHSNAGITINIPESVTEVTGDTLTFLNLSTLAVSRFPARGEAIRLPNGFYDCSYTAEVTYRKGLYLSKTLLQGLKESIPVTGDADLTFTLNTSIVESKEDFIIEEIFFTGTLRATGTQYYGDSFVKLYNNTDRVLYADGIALLESKFLSVSTYDYTPDIREDTFTVHAVYVVPGNGLEHPVQPGESFLICDNGMDHRQANPNSFDLSHADFEWYDKSNSPSTMDIDSKTPNLDKYYCYTATIWVLHNRGFRSYAIARMEADSATFLKDYFYTYKYVMHLPQGDFPMSQSAYKIPNSWIVDGVNCSVEPERVWNVLPPSIDAGWTHCGLMDSDKTRYFKSVRRKMLYLREDGRRLLKDTNNSSEDFNTECIPSIIEEQGTAIDAAGTKASRITCDGIQIKN